MCVTHFRDTLIWHAIAVALLIAASTFHSFAPDLRTPLMVAFYATAITLYVASFGALALGVASLVIGIKGLRK